MKKSDKKTVKETSEEELKRLRKENAKLRKENDALLKAKDDDKAKIKEIKKELSKERKKRRAESEAVRRTMEVAFEPDAGYRYSLQIIMLCVLIYARTSCGYLKFNKIRIYPITNRPSPDPLGVKSLPSNAEENEHFLYALS